MTSGKHLKARIRARMARTGERYSTARRHVVGAEPAPTDHGWALRGGIHPDSANIANLLAHAGVPGLSEATVLGIGGGLGAGYILWEFKEHRYTNLTLGYRYRWNYIDWTARTLDRLGATAHVHATSGAKGAAAELSARLDAGQPAIVWPDRQLIGYWHLPSHIDGFGGHPVVVYAATGDAVRVDDRNLAPLTVERSTLDRARGRVSSYKNNLVVAETVTAPADLAPLVRAGIVDCVAHLGGESASFAVPAWGKWARLVADPRNAKGWPRVFADGRGLTDALLSIWEGVEPVGMSGGHLRDLYADFLDEAAPLVGETGAAAEAFREAGRRWHDLAEAALPADVPEYQRLRELTADLAAGVAAGDDGATARAEAAGELWALRADMYEKPPAEVDFAALATHVSTVYEAERDAVEALRRLA
ncbi:BtrH N-terminal domain-containing protein [Phytohabitans sp. ZYX-F-186]|uniref:BtrH N-terminal domain-containing protein n=1 Tax=Phytohabitans maris TaxID=3071409 RepID=A0ABU0ZM83_9ACTN|nr:BtrH N-terminal domain-containing protein [Phytohabitans sp. ZYX-F-186]MDQ7908145.1 BtrH N-terminal domain-containing protein [Phytohabitans sp. ZYX-F-186]